MTGPTAAAVNGLTLHYRDEGPAGAPAVVFSNSLGTDFRVWDALMPLMPAGLRVIRYDKRGHGLSDCPAGPWQIADHAADLAALLDRLGVTQTVVVGLSVGGLIGQQLAAMRPDLVRALVLMDTAARIGNEEMWNTRIATVRSKGIAALAGPILERWFSARFRAENPALPLWRAMLTRTPMEGYALTSAAIRDADLTESTRRLAIPVLAMAGSEDGSTPPDLVRATADLIAGARFHVIDGVGHLPCVEAPEETARLIAGFLREIGHG